MKAEGLRAVDDHRIVRVVDGGRRDPEFVLNGRIMRRELGTQFGDAALRTPFVRDALRKTKRGAPVDGRSAAEGRAGQDGNSDILCGGEPPFEIQVRDRQFALREVLRRIGRPSLKHDDSLSGAREHGGRHAPSRAAADHDDVGFDGFAFRSRR